MTKLAKIKESDVQRTIKEWLQWHGYYVIKIHQSLGSVKGIADLYAIKNGVHYWIEVKMPKGKLSDSQYYFKSEIEAHGGHFRLARGIEDLKELEG
jgi:Holliday junction resolvase